MGLVHVAALLGDANQRQFQATNQDIENFLNIFKTGFSDQLPGPWGDAFFRSLLIVQKFVQRRSLSEQIVLLISC